MPSYTSVNGKWYPVNEKHLNPNAETKDDAFYEGPDRAAQEELDKKGVKFLGKDASTDPDLIRASRELGFKSTDEYLKTVHGVDPKEVKTKQEAKLKTEIHDSRKKKVVRKKAVRTVSGGDDTSGQGKHIVGGMGETPFPTK